MTSKSVSKILVAVYAGGASKRMGLDKLMIKIDGVRVIEHVLSTVLEISGRVVLLTTQRHRDHLQEYARLYGVELIIDEELPCTGPARSLATLSQLVEASERILTIPGDAAWIEAKPLKMLVDLGEVLGVETVSPLWCRGWIESLYSYTTGKAVKLIRDSCSIRRDLSRPSDLHRVSESLGLIGVSHLSSNPAVLRTPNTLNELLDSPSSETCIDIIVVREHSKLFIESLEDLRAGNILEAAEKLAKEARVYLNRGVLQLAAQSLLDACILYSRAGKEASNLLGQLASIASRLKGKSLKWVEKCRASLV